MTSNRYTTTEEDGFFKKTDHETGRVYQWRKRKKPVRVTHRAHTGVTLDQLTELGHKVRIKHFRYAEYRRMPGVLLIVPAVFRHDPNYRLLHKGGYTHITIRAASGEYICVSSACSPLDSFSYSAGIARALERLSDPDLALLYYKVQKV
jgi:hypothetical protein